MSRGLGKGLSALIDDSDVTLDEAPATPGGERAHDKRNMAQELPIHALKESRFQPRRIFNEEQLAELADSIRKNGIVQPLILRRDPDNPEMYEIIAGERRWRAAKLAQLATVPAIVREFTDKQALEIALIENIQRQDLNPVEEANGYFRLMEEFSYTQEELSQTVGKSRSHIANLLRLLTLPNEVKRMMEIGEISMGHARILVGTENPTEIARLIAKKGLSVRQTEKIAREAGITKPQQNRVKKEKAQAAPAAEQKMKSSREKDPDIIALEESLTSNIGLAVSIDDNGQGGGEVTISYHSLEELDDILRRLGG